MTIYLTQPPMAAVDAQELRKNAALYTELKASYQETKALLKSQKKAMLDLKQTIQSAQDRKGRQHQSYVFLSPPDDPAPTLRKGTTPYQYNGPGVSDVNGNREEWGSLQRLDAEGKAALLSPSSRRLSKPGPKTRSTSRATSRPTGCGLDFGSDSMSENDEDTM
jgi:hypothetical protein